MENNMMELGMDEMELVNGGIEFNVMKAIGGGSWAAASAPLAERARRFSCPDLSAGASPAAPWSEPLPWPPLREPAWRTDYRGKNP